eukprot:732855-Rhodomonas_salina.2
MGRKEIRYRPMRVLRNARYWHSVQSSTGHCAQYSSLLWPYVMALWHRLRTPYAMSGTDIARRGARIWGEDVKKLGYAFVTERETFDATIKDKSKILVPLQVPCREESQCASSPLQRDTKCPFTSVKSHDTLRESSCAPSLIPRVAVPLHLSEGSRCAPTLSRRVAMCPFI